MESRIEGEGAMNQGQGIDDWDDLQDLRPDVLDVDDVDPMDVNEVEQLDGDNRARVRGGLALASFAGLTAAAAALGRATNRGGPGLWYRTLRKPPFQPPSWIFAPVWTGLYALIATSGYRVWKAAPGTARKRALALWGAQLALNGAWSPLFFGARRTRIAFVDLLALLGVVVAYAETARKIDRPAAGLVLPYLGWLGFAAVLNEEIVRRKRGWRRLFVR